MHSARVTQLERKSKWGKLQLRLDQVGIRDKAIYSGTKQRYWDRAAESIHFRHCPSFWYIKVEESIAELVLSLMCLAAEQRNSKSLDLVLFVSGNCNCYIKTTGDCEQKADNSIDLVYVSLQAQPHPGNWASMPPFPLHHDPHNAPPDHLVSFREQNPGERGDGQGKKNWKGRSGCPLYFL